MEARRPAQTDRHRPAPPEASAIRLGCVSYLNAKPLIEGIEELDEPACPRVHFDVPSRLLDDLERGVVDLALCPVIDYFRCPLPLRIVPAGAIGSDGATLTVRLYSRVPIGRITTVYADTDSHTSVALLRVLLREQHGLTPELVDYHAREQVARHRLVEAPEAMLLIGDKVVTASPAAVAYPHQLDLGEAWKELTGLPFVFAVWMCRAQARLGDLPALLDRQRRANSLRLHAIADRHAPRHGWPADLARRYLGHHMRYGVGAEELDAIRRFGDLCRQAGVIEQVRGIELYE